MSAGSPYKRGKRKYDPWEIKVCRDDERIVTGKEAS
jgi:hypothetical protein